MSVSGLSVESALSVRSVVGESVWSLRCALRCALLSVSRCVAVCPAVIEPLRVAVGRRVCCCRVC